MFGTVAKCTVKPGKDEEMLALASEWTKANSSAGQIAGYTFKLEKQPGEYMSIAIFPSRDEYYRFAQRSETDEWYRKWRELLEADPEWNDGEVIQSDVFARI